MWFHPDFWNGIKLFNSNGEKLERWGKYYLVRPDPQAIWEGDKIFLRLIDTFCPFFSLKLHLTENEREMVEHIICQMEEERGLDRSAAIADMRFSFIHAMCDQVAVMRKGQILEQGSAEEIFAHPKDEYTKKLLSSRI